MQMEAYIDVTPLEAAYEVFSEASNTIKKSGARGIGHDLANDAEREFTQFVFASAKKNPKMYWHLFKANRVGVPGHELFKAMQMRRDLAGRSDVSVEWVLLPNTETLHNYATGNLKAYEREGVTPIRGDERLGIRASVKYKDRVGKTEDGDRRLRDYRDHRKSYKWVTQAMDVEFGRKFVITPRPGSDWLAVATGDRGVIMVKRRIIDYSQWGKNGFGGFNLALEAFFPGWYEDKEEYYQAELYKRAAMVTKKMVANDKTLASKISRRIKSMQVATGGGAVAMRVNRLDRPGREAIRTSTEKAFREESWRRVK